MPTVGAKKMAWSAKLALVGTGHRDEPAVAGLAVRKVREYNDVIRKDAARRPHHVVGVVAAVLTLAVQLRCATCKNRPFGVNFSNVCPEAVLVK